MLDRNPPSLCWSSPWVPSQSLTRIRSAGAKKRTKAWTREQKETTTRKKQKKRTDQLEEKYSTEDSNFRLRSRPRSRLNNLSLDCFFECPGKMSRCSNCEANKNCSNFHWGKRTWNPKKTQQHICQMLNIAENWGNLAGLSLVLQFLETLESIH